MCFLEIFYEKNLATNFGNQILQLENTYVIIINFVARRIRAKIRTIAPQNHQNVKQDADFDRSAKFRAKVTFLHCRQVMKPFALL